MKENKANQGHPLFVRVLSNDMPLYPGLFTLLPEQQTNRVSVDVVLRNQGPSTLDFQFYSVFSNQM